MAIRRRGVVVFGKRRIDAFLSHSNSYLSKFVFLDFECTPNPGSAGIPHQAGVCALKDSVWTARFWNSGKMRFCDFLTPLFYEFPNRVWVHWDGPEFEIVEDVFVSKNCFKNCDAPVFLDAREIWKDTCESGLLGENFPRNGGGTVSLSLSSALMFFEKRRQTHNALKDAIDTRDVLFHLMACGWNPGDLDRRKDLEEKAVKKVLKEGLHYIVVAKGAYPGVHPYKTPEERKHILQNVVGNASTKGKVSWREFERNQKAEAEAWFIKNGGDLKLRYGFLQEKAPEHPNSLPAKKEVPIQPVVPEVVSKPSNTNSGFLKKTFSIVKDRLSDLVENESHVPSLILSAREMSDKILKRGIYIEKVRFGVYEDDLFSSEMFSRRSLSLKISCLASILVETALASGVNKATIDTGNIQFRVKMVQISQTRNSVKANTAFNDYEICDVKKTFNTVISMVSNRIENVFSANVLSLDSQKMSDVFSESLLELTPLTKNGDKKTSEVISWHIESSNNEVWEIEWFLNPINGTTFL